MKTKQTKLFDMLNKGILHCNEAMTAPPVTDAGGGQAASTSNAGDSGGESSGIDWGGMFEDNDSPAPESEPKGSETVASPATAEVPAPTAPAAPAQPEAAAAVPPVTPPVTAEVPQQPATVQAPEPAQPQQTQQERDAAIAQARQAWRGQLAQQYQLSEEQATGLLTDPGKVLPEIAADLHVSVLENTMQALRQILPDMIVQQQRQTVSLEEGQRAFYEAWPELKGKEAVVMQMGAIWRQANPQATREEFIKQVGPLAWNAAGLSLSDLVNRGGGSQSTPPQAPVPQGGYSPAPQSAGGGVPTAAPQEGLFASLSKEWEND